MTRALRILVFALMVGFASPGQAARIEGVDFRDHISIDGVALNLHGTALLRYRVFFRAYVAALYLAPGTKGDDVLTDVPRRLEIEYFWSIPAHGFVRATSDGVRKNVDAQSWERIRADVDRFNALYVDVEPGDRYQLTYLPGMGTEIALNGVRRGHIAGAEFAAALFSLWLGEYPFDASLKSQLLNSH